MFNWLVLVVYDRHTLEILVELVVNRLVYRLEELSSFLWRYDKGNGNGTTTSLFSQWMRKKKRKEKKEEEERIRLNERHRDWIKIQSNYLDYQPWSVKQRNHYLERLLYLSMVVNYIVDATNHVYPNRVHVSDWFSWHLCRVNGQYRLH